MNLHGHWAIIASRHPAAVEFIRLASGLDAATPVVAEATEADVRGAIVYGNLPLHLAALADAVVAVEFTGPAPRGTEYTLADMRAAGARLRVYRVRPCASGHRLDCAVAVDDSDGDLVAEINGVGQWCEPGAIQACQGAQCDD